jgi:hypothetical protein
MMKREYKLWQEEQDTVPGDKINDYIFLWDFCLHEDTHQVWHSHFSKIISGNPLGLKVLNITTFNICIMLDNVQQFWQLPLPCLFVLFLTQDCSSNYDFYTIYVSGCCSISVVTAKQSGKNIVSVVATLFYVPPCEVPGWNLHMFQLSIMTPSFRVQQLLNGAGVTFQTLCRHLLFVSGRE